jgi:hypothetical protein
MSKLFSYWFSGVTLALSAEDSGTVEYYTTGTQDFALPHSRVTWLNSIVIDEMPLVPSAAIAAWSDVRPTMKTGVSTTTTGPFTVRLLLTTRPTASTLRTCRERRIQLHGVAADGQMPVSSIMARLAPR